MQGNGGTMSVDVAARHAVSTLMSGPAAGVKAAAYTALAAGHRNIITCDMGGTSFDVGVIRDGRPGADRGQGDGLRPARARADDRHPHHRRGRRLDRARELGRHPAGRARERRRRSRADLLRARRRGADDHRRQPRCSAASIPPGCSAWAGRRAARSHPRDLRQEDRRPPRARRRTRWPARSCAWPTTRWRAPSAWCRSSAATTRATSSLFAFGGAGPLHAVALAARAGDPEGAGARAARHHLRARLPAWPTCATTSCKTVNQGVLRLDLAEAHRDPGGAGGRGPPDARLRRRGGRDGQRPARGGHAVRRADPRADRADRADRLRARGPDARLRGRVLGALRGRAARDARARW